MGATRTEDPAAPPVQLTLLLLLSPAAASGTVEAMLRALLVRGHQVLVALDGEGDTPAWTERLDALRSENSGLQYRVLPERRDVWLYPATALRRRLDHLRSLEPGVEVGSPFGDRPPLVFRTLLAVPPLSSEWGRQLLIRVMGRLEKAMPIPRSARKLLAERRPDRLLVSPLVEFGSAQVDFVRAAHTADIPSVLVIASRHDLVDEGGLRTIPALTLAPDAEQAEIAIRLHGLPPERVLSAELDDDAAAASAVEAVARLTASQIPDEHEGRLLRPFLWLLTPVLAILLPLLRPRATARAALKAARRQVKRIRTWRQRRHREAQRQAKLKAREAKQRERERAIAAREQRKVRAEAAKTQAEAARRADKDQAETAKRAGKERAEAAKRAGKTEPAGAGTGGADAGRKRRARAAAELERRGRSAAKAKRRDGKPAAKPRRSAMQRLNGRVRKRARGRAKALRRRWKHTRRGVRRVYNRRYRFTYRAKITRVPARDELPALLNARGLVGRGAEIGVKTGVYSDELLTNWRGEELISIDPWLSADPDEYVDRSNVSQDEFERFYEQTVERLSKHGPRSTIWRTTSVEAAKRVSDHSLDFVYIDARHDYDSVLEDLEAWCQKVKSGGILAGHDYVDGDLPQGEFYVKSAVDEFFGARGIPVHCTEGPSVVEMFPTWIVEVPGSGIRPPQAQPSTPAPADGAGGGSRATPVRNAASKPESVRAADE